MLDTLPFALVIFGVGLSVILTTVVLLSALTGGHGGKKSPRITEQNPSFTKHYARAFENQEFVTRSYSTASRMADSFLHSAEAESPQLSTSDLPKSQPSLTIIAERIRTNQPLHLRTYNPSSLTLRETSTSVKPGSTITITSNEQDDTTTTLLDLIG